MASFSREQNTYNNLKNSTVFIKPSIPIIQTFFKLIDTNDTYINHNNCLGHMLIA